MEKAFTNLNEQSWLRLLVSHSFRKKHGMNVAQYISRVFQEFWLGNFFHNRIAY